MGDRTRVRLCGSSTASASRRLRFSWKVGLAVPGHQVIWTWCLVGPRAGALHNATISNVRDELNFIYCEFVERGVVAPFLGFFFQSRWRLSHITLLRRSRNNVTILCTHSCPLFMSPHNNRAPQRYERTSNIRHTRWVPRTAPSLHSGGSM